MLCHASDKSPLHLVDEERVDNRVKTVLAMSHGLQGWADKNKQLGNYLCMGRRGHVYIPKR